MSRPERIGWGILGPARIANSLVPAVHASADGDLVAVASRDPDRADVAATRWGARRAHGSYAALLKDHEVDVVYVPLPNHLHAEWTVRALEAGKHVLCEKPLVLSLVEHDAVRRAAETSQRVVLEAFMYRYATRWRSALGLLADGAGGEPRVVRVGFAFAQHPRGYDIRFDPHAGGGILWDMGCYLTAMGRDVLGTPIDVVAIGDTRENATVTTSLECLVRYSGARTEVAHTSFDYPNPYSQVEVIGTEGWLALPGTGMRAEPYTELMLHRGPNEVFAEGRPPAVTRFPFEDPYLREVEHLHACIRQDQVPTAPLDDARENLLTLLALERSRELGRIVGLNQVDQATDQFPGTRSPGSRSTHQ